MNSKKNILILGATGFIGRNLVGYLSDKYRIYIPSHKELDLLNQDIIHKYFRTHKIDVVINATVLGGSRKEEHELNALNNNLRIFFNIVSDSKYYKKLIHFGSGAEYDKSGAIVKVREEDFGKSIPSDDYGLFKYACSKYIESSKNIINLRIFGLYGKYEDYRYRFISNAICRNLFHLPIEINQDVLFDYVFIDDFVKIIDYFINNEEKHNIYNIGTGKSISISRLAQVINEISDYKSNVVIKNKGFNKEYTCNSERLIKELPKNFRFANLKKSLEELYSWYKTNKHLIKKEDL